MKHIPLDTSLEQMLISAERYALGRRTYIVSDTTEYITTLLPNISDWCIRVLGRDLQDAINQSMSRSDNNVLGDICDAEAWLLLYESIKKETKRRHTDEDIEAWVNVPTMEENG